MAVAQPVTVCGAVTVSGSNWFEPFVKLGMSFTGSTVTVKLIGTSFTPSLTFSVIRAEPDNVATGVIVTERLAPEPPTEILVSGTRAVLLEVEVTVNDATAVSGSPTVKL